MNDILKNTSDLNPTTYFEGEKKGVVFFPDFKSNPYQHLFYREINRQKRINVFGFPSNKFSKETINALKDKCKYIHMHWLHPFFSFSDKTVFLNFIDTVIHAKMNGFKIIWTVHNLISHESQDQDYEINIMTSFAEFCDKIIVHSEYAKKMVCEKYDVNPSIIVVIPHGHYAEHYPNKIGKLESKKRLGLQSDDFVFLCFGQIREYKGINDLLKIFENIKDENVKLLIAGRQDSEKTSAIIKKYSEKDKRIIFAGEYIKDEDVQIYFNACDFVVFPFKRILTSGSVVLALSFFKPVIAPAMGGLPEIIDKKTGILFDDLADLEKIIKELISKDSNNTFENKHTQSLLNKINWKNIMAQNIKGIFCFPEEVSPKWMGEAIVWLQKINDKKEKEIDCLRQQYDKNIFSKKWKVLNKLHTFFCKNKIFEKG